MCMSCDEVMGWEHVVAHALMMFNLILGHSEAAFADWSILIDRSSD